MIKQLVWLIPILLLGLTFSCGGGSDEIPKQEIDQSGCDFIGKEIILESPQGNMPGWMQDRPWRGMDEDGQPYIFFYAEGRSKDKNLAMRSARGNAAAAAAESITKNVLSQFAEAVESWGSEEDEQIEQVRMSLVAFKSKVKVSGQIDMGTYTYQIEKVGGLQSDGCTRDRSQSTSLWVAVIRQGISYSDYQRLREQAFASAREEVPEAANLIAQAETELEESNADEFTEAESWDDIYEAGASPVQVSQPVDTSAEADMEYYEEEMESTTTTSSARVDADLNYSTSTSTTTSTEAWTPPAPPTPSDVDIAYPTSVTVKNETSFTILFLGVLNVDTGDTIILSDQLNLGQNATTRFQFNQFGIDWCVVEVFAAASNGAQFYGEFDVCSNNVITFSSNHIIDAGTTTEAQPQTTTPRTRQGRHTVPDHYRGNR